MILGNKFKNAVFGATLASAVFMGVANVGEASPNSVVQENYSSNAIIQQANSVNNDISVDKAVGYDEEYFKSPEYLGSIKGVQYSEKDLKNYPFLQNWQGYMPLPTFKSNRAIDRGDGFTDAAVNVADSRFFKEKDDLKYKYASKVWMPTSIANLQQNLVHNKSAVAISAEVMRQKAWINGGQAPERLKYNDMQNEFDIKLTHFDAHTDFRNYRPLMMTEPEYDKFKSVFPEGLTTRNMKLVPFFVQHERGFDGYTLKEIPNISLDEYRKIKDINPKAFSGNDYVSQTLRTQFASLDNAYGIQGMKQMSTASLGVPSYHSETVELNSFRVPRDNPSVALRHAQMIARTQLQKEGKAYGSIVPQDLVQNSDGTFNCKVVCQVKDNVRAQQMNVTAGNQQYDISDGVLRGQDVNDLLRVTGNSAVADYRELGNGNVQRLGYPEFEHNDITGVNLSSGGAFSKPAAIERIDDNVGSLNKEEIESIENFIAQQKAREAVSGNDSVKADKSVELGDHQYMDYGNGKGVERISCSVLADNEQQAVELSKNAVVGSLDEAGRFDAGNSSLKILGSPVLKDGVYHVQVEARDIFPEKVDSNKREQAADKAYEPFNVKDVMAKADSITKRTTELADARNAGNADKLVAAGKNFDSSVSELRSVVETKCHGDKTVMGSFDKFALDSGKLKDCIVNGDSSGSHKVMDQMKVSYSNFSNKLMAYGRLQDIRESGTIVSPEMSPDAFYRNSVNKALKDGIGIHEAQNIGTKDLVKNFGIQTSERVLKSVAPDCVNGDAKSLVDRAVRSIEKDRKAQDMLRDASKKPLAKIEPKTIAVSKSNSGMER